MLMLVRSFVRPFGPNLSRAVNFQLYRSDSTQRAIRASKSYSRSLKYCVLFYLDIRTHGPIKFEK